jgi:hypothetical protein
VDTSVLGSRLERAETQWTNHIAIAHDPFRSDGNGVIWEAPDGVVWEFCVARFKSQIRNSKSKYEGAGEL